ncbi:10567_t:CDS:2 [Ambispora gerdemannii]|uniref:10567_t:CDS:1 n=1 Tax=Ambispora gerdemannii TaxID=144530 RepID=A0A9N8W2M7_9GLOM|nr:10567_t:CDS:2 [Ambispora gerdemannii]
MATNSGATELPQSTPVLIGQLLQRRKFIVNESNKVTQFGKETISSTSTVFLRDCNDCEYIIDGTCTKVMIENCNNLVLKANKKIVTSIIEVWKSQNVTLKINSQVQTLQLDDCHKVNVEYDSVKHFHSIVWTGTKELELTLLEDGEVKHKITKTQEQESSNNSQPTQSIIRLINGELVEERLIRAEKGYPITERELREWKQKNNVA